MSSGRTCFAGALLAILTLTAGAQSNPPAQSKPTGKQPPKTQPTPAKKQPRKRVAIDLSGFDLLEPKGVTKQTVVPGATRGIPTPVALAPKLARVYGAAPVFVWDYSGKSDGFTFVLQDDADNELLREDVKGNSYTYPASAPKLQAGRTYFWMVDVNGSPLLSATSDRAGFVVLPDAEQAEIVKALAAHPGDGYDAMMARAQVMVDKRVWYDAIAAFTELAAKFPDEPAVYEGRGNVYGQLAATKKLADADFAKADTLKAKAKK